MTRRALVQADARAAPVLSLHLSLQLLPSLVTRLEMVADSDASSLAKVAALRFERREEARVGARAPSPPRAGRVSSSGGPVIDSVTMTFVLLPSSEAR